MRIRIHTAILLLLAVTLAFSACEKNGNQFFRSKRGMDKKLQGEWTLISKNQDDQIWTFEEGTVQRLHTAGMSPGYQDPNGLYSLNAGLFKAHMNISSMADSTFNEKFEIVRLDKEFLGIFLLPAVGGGHMLLEFQKQP